ncbi:multi-sensor signal transduction histidine kinase [Parvibaculum lavamentivorans DS-1]|uniref:histidine kinase n=1 Tax=Parvibaculum lavamentivorans (strain DS-1 / DSM 13023 / NCIMB 13966) TaxID=402881 RepID=A7HXV2_PARL1|nr:multi-sensor signal transduction histidine kinase [Parvibaculum lavamentivorans DS-1]
MVPTEQPSEAREARAESWESRLWQLVSRRGFSTTLSVGLVVAAICLGSFTYMLLTGLTPFSPTRPVLISLLLANLTVVLILFALIFWRMIRIILARVSGTAGAKLHSRLVTMFAIVAVMPAIIVAVFAAVTLNRGLDTWFGERAQLIISNAETVAEAYLNEHRQVLRGDTLAMATDIQREAELLTTDPAIFQRLITGQMRLRSLQAAYVVKSDGRILSKARASVEVGMPAAEYFEVARAGDVALFIMDDYNQIRALVALPAVPDTYLYVARFVDARVLNHLAETRAAVSEYESLESRRSQFQVTFALIYVTVALITLLAAIWLGLWAANRIVDPISHLVRAAERVSVGDLRARVPVGGSGDELDMLTGAFNRMTSQLESQRNDLIEANHQLDERRQFTEAVLSGVSAGVLGLDNEGRITHANRAALRFFALTEAELIGRMIAAAVPEMALAVADARAHPDRTAQAQVVIPRAGQDRTLNLRVTREMTDSGQGGFVLTFDDITELVRAQRTSAWADVARRIAHEIKNPLTPIQLSAERLRRKYSKEITTDPDVFEQCTQTIIRQVNDIGRMVDEFSSFARMPSASMKPLDINEILRQSVFLQRVGHPDIEYQLTMPETPTILECDGRLVSQALTNILKNAAEAIRGREEDEEEDSAGTKGHKQDDVKLGRIHIALAADENNVTVTATDSGCGLPETGRSRLTEPYMTTRAKGTGLGLAIVNKVMEDHGGELVLEDAPVSEGWESGARVRLVFPRKRAAASGLENGAHEGAGVIEEAVDGV